MPAAYAHILITEQALARLRQAGLLDRQLQGRLLLNSHFAYLGAVSPDYPYLDFKQPQQALWADHMHYDVTGELLQTMARRLAALPTARRTAPEGVVPLCWTLGYLSHVTADLTVHPVVRKIVGDYADHKTEHRQCEMVQDVYIYHRMRQGAEIRHSALLGLLRNCADPADPERVHRALVAYWQDVLQTHFAGDYQTTPPRIDEWDDWYQGAMHVAGRPLFLGRLADPDHKVTYPLSTELTPEDRATYVDALPFPDGTVGTYDRLFEKAVTHVLERWTTLLAAVAGGRLQEFCTAASNCNLDTGTDVQTGRLVCWA